MSSKFFGVCWNAKSKAWQASMTRSKTHGGDGKQKHLGHYDDERSAALAVDVFVREHMPALTAKLNFPDMDPRDLERELARAKERRQRRQRSRPGTAICSKYIGVTWNAMNKAWKAQMYHSKKHGGDGKTKFLGYHDDERSAALAVDSFIRENMPGLTAKLNFPDMDPRDLAQAKERRRRERRSTPGTAAMHSQYFGVYWNAKKEAWVARMRHGKKYGGDGKPKFLGFYDDERSAAIAVDAFIRERMPGLLGKLNCPDMDPQIFARELAQVQRRGRRGAAAPSRKRPRSRSSPVVNETATRPRLSDQPIPSTREERMLAIAASPTARALFRLATAHRSRKS